MNNFHLTKHLNFLFLMLLALVWNAHAQINPPFQDLMHESKVFGHNKFYRLYLPDTYQNSQKRFPVIYFFHGWGGRHSSDDNAKLDYEKLKELVNKYQVMMVMWDGNMEEDEPRPYNVGNHEDVKFQVQMKDYFPELVSYVDATYRTFADRDHRAIIGFSMGGFMSLYLSGKYPDMVCSAVSMMGSPEFFVGMPDNQTLYPVRYTFENLQDVQMRVHTSPTDILYFLNQEVKAGAKWQGKKVEFEEFPGGHMVDKAGETVVFEKAMQFISKDLGKKHAVPAQWSHYDLDGNFGLWDYEVHSDKNQPGFIYVKDVGSKGFGLYTKKWLPHGPVVEMGNIKLTTAPIYKPGQDYQTATFSFKNGKVSVRAVKAGAKGNITLELEPEGSETGIFSADDHADWGFLDYNVGGKKRLKTATPANKLSVRIFNRGNEAKSENLKIIISSNDPAVIIKDSAKTVQVGKERVITVPEFEIFCTKKPPFHAEPADVKLTIKVIDATGSRSTEIGVPVDFDVPFFTNIKIDDGKIIRKTAFGTGNADGEVNAGENILVYEGENRLRIYSEGPGIIAAKEQFNDEMIPGRWPDGFTQNSVIQIAADSKPGQEIECLASYETKTFNPIERKVTWGRVKLKVVLAK